MFCSSNSVFRVPINPSINPKSPIFSETKFNPFHEFPSSPKLSSRFQIRCTIRKLRDRIDTVKNTQKIAEAMKLVAAAKVRRAQEAVINGRPFAEGLADMLYNINLSVQLEDVDVPLASVRTVKRVALVVITGERGLCGGFNSAVIRKAESRIQELQKLGLGCTIISVGKKGNAYFSRRVSDVSVDRFVEGEGFPTAREAQTIADDVFSLFVSEEVDKVELLYTKFVSLVRSDPVIRTLLPLSPKGKAVDAYGNSVDALEDEFFRLTSKEGKLAVERLRVEKRKQEVQPLLEFEQDPVQIIDAMMPLYLNSQILRALQESLASELAARMNAMNNANENAMELKKTLSIAYNRERQTKITEELLEIVAGAEALVPFD
ncbi:ATP synthase gamma chain 2, chloroplastic-like [Chenopodium quinoa]|uniref:ATP synthase gamma chain n=1 Tax=Chenopodium quinoa TaxID=63459 RepID=A0A803LY83_CHEQI|nr:ATP synthase gamma chain 2, chloroplastic-like [Chenopodium quinoa]